MGLSCHYPAFFDFTHNILGRTMVFAHYPMIELLTAKNNVERILGVTEKEKNRDRQQGAR